ncbi:MAG: hypothetical protein IPL61_22955 [Myxococcales bacterium]|nr:hypothetical protein [Myxococcales bacterium]
MHMYRSRKVRKRRTSVALDHPASTRRPGRSASATQAPRLAAQANIAINRKMLSEIAISDPAAFQAIATAAK